MKKNKKKYAQALWGLLILLALIVSWLFYTETLRDNFQNEIISSLEEVSAQGQNNMKIEINGKLELLNEVARRISLYKPEEYRTAVSTLLVTCEENGFKRMGIISADGDTYTTDGVEINLADREYYKRGLAGESGISEPLLDREGNGGINVYSVPIHYSEKIAGVLFATCATDVMREQLAVSSFNGEGYTYIVDDKGNCVVESLHPNSYPDMKNVFTALSTTGDNNEASIEQMRRDFETEEKGCIKYWNKGYRYMYYCPLGINEWYLLTVAPANVLDSKMNGVVMRTYLLGVFLFLLFGSAMFYIFRDQKKRKQELIDILYTDSLTGGYSYTKFQAEAEKLLIRTEKVRLAALNIDIDDFKFVNEMLGYEEGNHLIRYVHGVLKDWCREGEIYAHQTADIFVVLIFDQGEEALCRRLDDLCGRLKSYAIKAHNKLQIVPSVGVFQIHDRSLSLDYCLDCAGIARKSRKGQFNHFYAFFDEDVKQQIYRNKRMEGEMKPALENGEFTPYYQPQYDAQTKKITGAEALVRWVRPDGSVVSPGEFIPLFEKNGFISELDKYMFRSVCAQQKKWLDEGYGVVPVSVNVSRKLLYDLNLVEKYNAILEETGLSVHYMEVEITESAFFDNRARLLRMVEKLHGAGFRILLDDFGTGYSSMAMLQDMAFDTLKIDKSFVDLIGDERGDKVVEGIIHLADSLGLGTIAEGVETGEQYEYLKHRGCRMIQGYYFGKPMTAEAFARLLER